MCFISTGIGRVLFDKRKRSSNDQRKNSSSVRLTRRWTRHQLPRSTDEISSLFDFFDERFSFKFVAKGRRNVGAPRFKYRRISVVVAPVNFDWSSKSISLRCDVRLFDSTRSDNGLSGIFIDTCSQLIVIQMKLHFFISFSFAFLHECPLIMMEAVRILFVIIKFIDVVWLFFSLQFERTFIDKVFNECEQLRRKRRLFPFFFLITNSIHVENSLETSVTIVFDNEILSLSHNQQENEEQRQRQRRNIKRWSFVSFSNKIRQAFSSLKINDCCWWRQTKKWTYCFENDILNVSNCVRCGSYQKFFLRWKEKEKKDYR